MAKDGYREALESAFANTGVKNRDFYAFRHSFCTRWLSAGGDAITLAHLTGTSVEMIAKTYGHLDLDWVRTIQSRMRGDRDSSPDVRERPLVAYAHDLPTAACN